MIEGLEILFEDKDILVISKPAGIVVNRAVSAKGITIQEWAEKENKLENFVPENGADEEFKSRGGVVHRLDKETSGALIIAKNSESFEKIKNQFKERSVKKNYIALVHGFLDRASGVIEEPIGRLPWNRTKFGVLVEGREARTDFEVAEYREYKDGWQIEKLTLLNLFPQTGRTHQIRVHLRHIGYPIFSDELYAGRKQSRKDRRVLSRHFLHASKIVFNHPRSGEEMVIEAPLSKDLYNFLSHTQKINKNR